MKMWTTSSGFSTTGASNVTGQADSTWQSGMAAVIFAALGQWIASVRVLSARRGCEHACLPSPPGTMSRLPDEVIEGSQADVSFGAGLLMDKFAV
jgi:hypothetical protein